jgi:uncharacterized protein (TIRG00374 family)
VKHRTALVSLLAVGLLVWFLRHADLSDVWRQVQHARLDLLLAALGIVASTYWARAARWWYLVSPIGPTRFRTVFRSTIIGFAALGLLPLRAGDALRAYLLARREGLSFSAVFATIVAERVLDLIAVLALLAVYLSVAADVSSLSQAQVRLVELFGVAALVLSVLLWVLASHPERVGGLVLMLNRLLPHTVADRLSKIALAFSSGLAVARRPRELMVAVAWSFVVWLFGAVEVWMVTKAFAMDLPFAGSFLLQALLVVGVAVPTPGGVGSFHEAYRFGMTTFFGASEAQAVAAAFVLHALSFGPVILAGLVLMVQDGLSFARLKELAQSAPQEGVATDR